MSLAESQRLFWDLVQGHAIDNEVLDRTFVGTAGLPAAERVQIYERMYLWRLVDALRADFPMLAALLGDKGFFEAMAQYVAACPSESPDVDQLGRRLPEFLRTWKHGRADLADLAALEWARAEVFSEASGTVVAGSVLASIPPEKVALARLRFIPALRLLSFEHDPSPIWKALDDGRPASEPGTAAAHGAVWRNGFDVFHAGLSLQEAAGLRQAMAGRPLGVVCEAFLGDDDATAAAFSAIASWFHEGWVAAVESDEGERP